MTIRQVASILICSVCATLVATSFTSMARADERVSAASISKDQKTRAGEFVRLVRESTERFKDVNVAIAENYTLHFGCVSGSDWGAMGLHYVNGKLLDDGKLDPTRPEIVIYEPLPNGRLRLIGADYLVYADAWDAKNIGPPQLGGQLFHLFESPNRFGLKSFYTLHVWAWKDNPSGAFVNWHPHVSCNDFNGHAH